MRSTRPRLRLHIHGQISEERGPLLTGTAMRLEQEGLSLIN